MGSRLNQKPNMGTAASVLVIAMFLDPTGKILVPLIRSDDWVPSEYRIPGGGVEVGMTEIQAVDSELHDETGLQRSGDAELLMIINKPSFNTEFSTHRQFVYGVPIDSIEGLLATSIDGGDRERLNTDLFELDDIKRVVFYDKPLISINEKKRAMESGKRPVVYGLLLQHRKILKQLFT